MNKQEFDNLTEDELIELVESHTRYQTNRGWVIALVVAAVLLGLKYYKIILWLKLWGVLTTGIGVDESLSLFLCADVGPMQRTGGS